MASLLNVCPVAGQEKLASVPSGGPAAAAAPAGGAPAAAAAAPGKSSSTAQDHYNSLWSQLTVALALWLLFSPTAKTNIEKWKFITM